MMASPRWWRRLKDTIGVTGIVVLIPTGAAFLLYVGLFAQSVYRQPTWRHLIALLFLWQTQTGAAFALAAALIGALAIVAQTKATDRRAEERRARRAEALRAVLPLLLSELTDYARGCAEIYLQVLQKPHPTELKVLTEPKALSPTELALQWPVDAQLPSLPTGFVEQLTELIEALQPDHAAPLIALVRSVQHQHARARRTQRDLEPAGIGLTKGFVLGENVIARVIDAAEVVAWCTKLIPYARGQERAAPGPISRNDISEAIRLLPNRFREAKETVQEQVGKETAKGRWPAQ